MMDDLVYMRLSEMYRMAYNDEEYCRMKERLSELEARYEEILRTLTQQQYEICCDYYELSFEMTARLLELACQNVQLLNE